MARTLTTPPEAAAAPAAQRPVDRLFAPIGIEPLVFFRVAFGLIAAWEAYRYASNGWIARYWIDPALNFTYPGFGWVRPLPPSGMYMLWGALGLLGVCIALGFAYRLSAALFFVGFTYSFLLEAARYLNHFYLISLLAALLVVVPAHRAFSVDAWLRPELRAATVPAWTLWLLRF